MNKQPEITDATREAFITAFFRLAEIKSIHKITIKEITKKNWLFLFSSGITTGLSWICYYKALQLGEASIVVPIDKLSIIVTIIFSYFVLKESLSKKAVAGLILIVAGTMLLLI